MSQSCPDPQDGTAQTCDEPKTLQIVSRDEIRRALGERSFAFMLLVHADTSSPAVEFVPSTSILQACPYA